MGNINIGQDEDKPTLTDLIDPEPQKVDLAIGNADDLNLASIDADLTIRSITPCMARALGFEASEVLGKRFLELLNPEDREHLEGTVRGALESMGAVEIGKVRPYSKAEGASELQLKAVVLEGAPSSVLLVGVTSPAQETASERPSSFELANRTHAWDNLISFSIDKDHKFIDFNARIGTMTGKVPRDMLGRDIREILDQDLAFQSEFNRCLTSVLSGDIRTADLPVLNRSGATVKIRCRLQPIMDSKGQIVGVTILGHETSAINLEKGIWSDLGSDLEALAGTSNDFAESEDLAEAIDKDLDKLIDSLGVDFAVFRLAVVETKPRMVCAGMDFRQGRELLESHLVGEGPLYIGVQSGRSFIALDAQKDPRLVLEDDKVRSLVCIPIRFHEDIYGCGAFGAMSSSINLQAKMPLLQLFCNQVAISMHKAHLKTELALKNKELESLHEVSMAVSGEFDLKKVLDTILNHAAELVQADAVYLFQVDKNAATLDLISAISPYLQEMEMKHLHVGEGITGLVAQTRQGTLVERADRDPRSVHVPGTPDEPSSLISVPLKMGDELLGVMTLERVPGVPFNEDDFKLIQLFSFQAATALNNVLMFNRLNEQAASQQMYTILLTHDVANYNVPIHGYLEMLAKDPKLDERQRRFVRSSLAQSENISSLIADVRKLSLLRTMEAVKTFEPIDLAKVVAEAIDSIGQNILFEDTEVRFAKPILSVKVMGDSFVKDIVYNLVSNACKHAGDAPIDVVLREHEESGSMYWRMDVKDMGDGVSEDRKAFLFRRFDCVDADSASEGHGIGLSVVSALCERFGGRVWVEDREPLDKVKGSVFSVILPKVKF